LWNPVAFTTERVLNMSPNKEILKGIIDGDSQIISRLLKQLTYSVGNSLKNSGLNDEDIEEAVMDAMVIFIKKVKSGEFKDQGIPVMSYLAKVARYRGNYYYRKKAANLEFPSDAIDKWKKEEEVTPETWDHVKRGLEELPASQRRLLELTYIEGYRDKEIIEAGLSEYSTISSLKSQRYKALRNLSKIVHRARKGIGENVRDKK